MSPATYAEAFRLDVPELRRLLRDGAAFQRVWAAWALGMRVGDDFSRKAGTLINTEPDPGVRRHLAVVLAGAGDHDAVLTLAIGDPSEHVRASAWRLLVQTAQPEMLGEVLARVLDASRTDVSPYVRAEAIRVLSAFAERPALASIAGALADPAVQVREAAVDFLAGAASDSANSLLAGAAAIEPVVELQTKIWRLLCDAGCPGRLLLAVLDLDPIPANVVDRALRAIVDREQRLPWSVLAKAAGFRLATIDKALFQAVERAADMELEFLVDRAVAGLRLTEPRSRKEHDIRHSGYMALKTLADIGRNHGGAPSVDRASAESLRWVLGVLEKDERALRSEATDAPEDEWVLEELDSMVYLRSGLACLVSPD